MILESVGERCRWSCLPQEHEGPPGSASALFLAAHCLAALPRPYPASLLCSHTAPCPGLYRCPSTSPVSLTLDCWLVWSPDAASLIDPVTLCLICLPTVMLPSSSTHLSTGPGATVLAHLPYFGVSSLCSLWRGSSS